MAGGSVASVYAQALLQLADERGKRTTVVHSCRGLGELLPAAVIRDLDDPRVGKERAKAILGQVLEHQVEPELIDLVRMLIDRNRLSDLPAILAEAVRSAEQQVGMVRVTITTAVPMAEDTRQRLTDSLARRFGPGVVIQQQVNAALLGGVTLRAGDLFVDGSVRRQLREVRARLAATPLAERMWVDG